MEIQSESNEKSGDFGGRAHISLSLAKTVVKRCQGQPPGC